MEVRRKTDQPCLTGLGFLWRSWDAVLTGCSSSSFFFSCHQTKTAHPAVHKNANAPPIMPTMARLFSSCNQVNRLLNMPPSINASISEGAGKLQCGRAPRGDQSSGRTMACFASASRADGRPIGANGPAACGTSCAAVGAEIILINAEAVLDLVRLQVRESGRQRARVKRLARKAKYPSPGKCSAVQIDKVRT